MRVMFDAWREKNKPEFHLPILPPHKDGVILDLAVDSLDLGHYENYIDLTAFSLKVETLIGNAGYGWGGYGEVRPFYTTDAYTFEGND